MYDKKNNNENLTFCLFNSANCVAVASTVWEIQTVKNRILYCRFEVNKFYSCIQMSLEKLHLVVIVGISKTVQVAVQ